MNTFNGLIFNVCHIYLLYNKILSFLFINFVNIYFILLGPIVVNSIFIIWVMDKP